MYCNRVVSLMEPRTDVSIFVPPDSYNTSHYTAHGIALFAVILHCANMTQKLHFTAPAPAFLVSRRVKEGRPAEGSL